LDRNRILAEQKLEYAEILETIKNKKGDLNFEGRISVAKRLESSSDLTEEQKIA
jgi:hypothetical protein